MSEIGFYRYKTPVVDGRAVKFYVNGGLAAEVLMEELPYCSKAVILKYIDTNGHYRFFTFNKYYEVNDNVSTVGYTDEFVTNIRSQQSNQRNVGNKIERRISLVANVSKEQLPIFSQIYGSPRILMYVGTLISDNPSDWVMVKLTGGDSVVRRSKQRGGSVALEITLPERYTQKML